MRKKGTMNAKNTTKTSNIYHHQNFDRVVDDESTAILSSQILLRCSGIDELNGSSTVFACCAISFTKCLLYVTHHSDNNILPCLCFRIIAKIRVLEVGPAINDVTRFFQFFRLPLPFCHGLSQKRVSPLKMTLQIALLPKNL